MAKPPAFERLETGDTAATQLQDLLTDFFQAIEDNPLLSGRMLDLDVTTVATAFPHGLGRTPEGWIVADTYTSGGLLSNTIWRTAWDDKTITLDASASFAVKVWVF